LNEVRKNSSPHWKKRLNKGHRHFTVNAYIPVSAGAERVCDIHSD
jgi:hypothetical protein